MGRNRLGPLSKSSLNLPLLLSQYYLGKAACWALLLQGGKMAPPPNPAPALFQLILPSLLERAIGLYFILHAFEILG